MEICIDSVIINLCRSGFHTGSWHWGGTVSSHKPVFIELNLPTANGAILAHGQVLLNGMVSVD